jgi:hypothetical protein
MEGETPEKTNLPLKTTFNVQSENEKTGTRYTASGLCSPAKTVCYVLVCLPAMSYSKYG